MKLIANFPAMKNSVFLILTLCACSHTIFAQDDKQETPVFIPEEGFTVLFDGSNLDAWTGNLTSYVIENGVLAVKPGTGSGGNLYTREQFDDFIFRFEFKLTEGANNGLGIRAPLEGDAAYTGLELQILDNSAAKYRNLQPYQYHGSVYGVVPAKRGYLRPPGEWNFQEATAHGSRVKVRLNGILILDADIEIHVVDTSNEILIAKHQLQPDATADVSIAADRPAKIGCRVLQVLEDGYQINPDVSSVAIEDQHGKLIMSASHGGALPVSPKNGKIQVRIRNLLDVPIEVEIYRK